MSKYRAERALRRELENLNEIIDQKIIRGLSYAREARRHKFILRSIWHIKRASEPSWFRKSFA